MHDLRTARSPNRCEEKQRFSNTSLTNRRPGIGASTRSELAERQTLQIQWFRHPFRALFWIHVRLPATRAAECGPCRIAKRYVCAAKSFEAF